MLAVDVLFVINQNVSLETIKKRLLKVQSAIVLSTHSLFEHEKQFLGSKVVSFFCFADFLSDADMSTIDQQVSEQLLAQNVAKNNFYDKFMKQVLINKNITVRELIFHDYQFKKIIAADGLGIVRKVWKPGISNIFSIYRKFFSLISLVKEICHKAKDFLFLPRNLYLINYHDNLLVFRFFPKRLNFVSDIEIVRCKIKKYFCFSKYNGNIVYDILQKQHAVKNIIFCNALHNQLTFSFSKKIESESWMFQDGFYPANYSRSYIDSLDCDRFICNSPFAQYWLYSNGVNAEICKDLLKYIHFSPISPLENYKNILLLLGHAGDWSALINRSDTDYLIEAFCKMAQEFPQYNFCIRLHPTMTHPCHEGTNSIKRIEKLVTIFNLKNLSISNRSLDEDIAWSDFCIGEYSGTLLTSLEKGKPVFFVNLTKRRSFMAELEQFGFKCVTSVTEFRDTLKHLEDIISQTEKAIGRANEYFKTY